MIIQTSIFQVFFSFCNT